MPKLTGEQASNTISELQAASEKMRTKYHMIQELRKRPGFENIAPATVYRWFREPTTMTLLALKALSAPEPISPAKPLLVQQLYVLEEETKMVLDRIRQIILEHR